MNLIQAQIAEIKNLNLIYVFTTDNILNNNTQKYIGAKIVYEKDKTFSLDYKSEYFNEFIKKVLNRYNKEKDRRSIVLLGDLTKKLVNESFFAIEDKQEFIQPMGILVNPKKNQINGYSKYLTKAIKTILKVNCGYDFVTVDLIDGFNNKYVVNYTLGNIKKQLCMLIFINGDDNVDFRISNIDGKTVSISGTIEDSLSLVNIKWYDDIKKIRGFLQYNSNENIIEEKVYKDVKPIISIETVDTLLEEDETIIKFYLDLCNLNIYENVMKIDDNCYLLSESKVVTKETDGIIYNNISLGLSIFDDEVIIRYREKNGLDKYNSQINVVLDEKLEEFVVKKLNIDNEYYILIEKRSKVKGKTTYNYNVILLDNDINLMVPFNIKNKQEINEQLNSFDMAKKYIKKMKGGN